MKGTSRTPKVSAGQIRRICDGMFYVFSTPEGASNAGIVSGSEATVVVDSRLTPALGAELAAVVGEEFRGADASLMVVNTHFHGDHWFGNAGFTGAVIVSSEWTREALRSAWRSQIERFVALRPERAEEFAAVDARLPQVGISDQLSVDVGGHKLSIDVVRPAHTPGDLVVWGDAGRAVFTGDLVFNEAWPVLWDADVAGWLTALDEIAAKAPDVVVPGHGPCGGVELVERMGAALELLTRLSHKEESAWPALVERSPFAGWSRLERIAPSVQRIRELG